MLYTAIAINSCAIIWFLIFMKYTYAGVIIGVSAIIWFIVFSKKKQDELELKFPKRFYGKNIRYLDKCAVFRAQESYWSEPHWLDSHWAEIRMPSGVVELIMLFPSCLQESTL